MLDHVGVQAEIKKTLKFQYTLRVKTLANVSPNTIYFVSLSETLEWEAHINKITIINNQFLLSWSKHVNDLSVPFSLALNLSLKPRNIFYIATSFPTITLSYL